MGATARKNTTAPSMGSVVPFAPFLDKVDPSTAERIKRDDPIRKPETDAFARAIRKLGGIEKAEVRAGISQWRLLDIVFGGVAADPSDCLDVENACLHEVKCEDMRADILWFRDAGGEVVGYAERLNGRPADLEAAIDRFVAGRGGPEIDARESVTSNPARREISEQHFGSIPVTGKSMFSVNQEMPDYWKLSEAVCMVDALAEVASNGVETPITSAQAWMLERNLRCVMALIGCASHNAQMRA